MTYKAHVSERKKRNVAELTELAKKYNVIALVDMNNLPAPQLQRMRELLRGKVLIKMTKKTLMKIVFNNLSNEKKDITKLSDYLEGMPALALTNEDPFKLAKILKENVSSAPAKAGQVAPDDIVVPKGKTNFPPGPIISELSSIGIKAGIEGGKVAVKEDAVVVKKGEIISDKVASVLKRLGIEPMKIGLRIIAAWDNGEVFASDVLSISTEKVLDDLRRAAAESKALALELVYPCSDVIEDLLVRAYRGAKALSLEAGIVTSDNIADMLAEAELAAQALSKKINN